MTKAKNICFQVIFCFFVVAVGARADTVIYSLENVILDDHTQMTGTFSWTYDPGDFENGVGVFIELEIPHTSHNQNDLDATIDATESIEITLPNSTHDDGVDITLVLTQPLTPTTSASIDLVLSKYEIGGNGFHTGLFISGTISPVGNVCASSGTLVEGTGEINDFTATCGSDDTYWAAHGTSLFFQVSDPVVQIELTATVPLGFGSSTISVDIEASKQNVNGNLNLRALLFNFTTDSYVSLPGIMPLATADAIQNFVLPGGSNPVDFIEPGTNEVRLLLQTIQTSGLPNVRTQLDEVSFKFD